jgi:uncharacterized membrane protein HdeD (DUF308 family)
MDAVRNVAVIIGSLRKNSINRKLAHALAEFAPSSLKLQASVRGLVILSASILTFRRSNHGSDCNQKCDKLSIAVVQKQPVRSATAADSTKSSKFEAVTSKEASMSINKPDIEKIQRAVATSLHEHWMLFLVEGIILVILGLAAIVIPPIATLAVEILFGWLFFISGIIGLITTFRMRQAPGFWWSLVSAILGIVAGIVLLLWPLSGVVSLTLILIVFFVIEGVASIMFALEHKRELSGQWAWMLASGIVDLILAAIIFAGLPGTAAWALGLLVGINMIFGGSALVVMALHAREIALRLQMPR